MKKISGIIISFVLIIGFLFVLTEYSGIPSAKDALSRVLSSTAGLSSVEYEINRTTQTSSPTISELKEETKAYEQEIIGTDNFHLEAEILINGEKIRGFSLYTAEIADGMTVYIGENDSWMKVGSKLKLSELNLGIDTFAAVIDFLRMTEPQKIEEAERDGKEVYVISGKIKAENAEDVISSIKREEIEELNEQSGMFEDIDIDKIFSDLAPATVEIIADAESFRLIEFKMDTTATAQSAYNNLLNEAGYGETGLTISIGEETTVRITSHNSFDTIEIPEEARNAKDFDFLQ